jgi:hypothetical protein
MTPTRAPGQRTTFVHDRQKAQRRLRAPRTLPALGQNFGFGANFRLDAAPPGYNRAADDGLGIKAKRLRCRFGGDSCCWLRYRHFVSRGGADQQQKNKCGVCCNATEHFDAPEPRDPALGKRFPVFISEES